MTARDYIDEVMLRLIRMNVMNEMNPGVILTFLNRARRDAQRETMKLFPERYGKILIDNLAGVYASEFEIAVNYTNENIKVIEYELPDDFLDSVVVKIGWDSNVSEARHVSKRELYGVGMHAFNMPTIWEPVYAIDRRIDEAGYPYKIYISGISYLFDQGFTPTLEMWYQSALHYIEDVNSLETSDNELTLPVEIEELVINYTLLYCSELVGQEFQYEVVSSQIDAILSLLQQTYQISIMRKYELIPSKEKV